MKKEISLLLLGIFIASVTYSQKVNKMKLDTLLKKAEQSHSESVIIYQNNNLVTEKYFGIGQANNKIESMSCTKSIVGLAVTCLLTDKLIDSLDIPVSKFYPEWRQGKKQFITLRHLVNMTSGLQNNPNASIEIYPSPNFVQLALAAELTNKPGEVWEYNNKSLNLMAGIIKQITGKRMDIYIGERLFKPLGITDFSWSLDSAGNPHVMSGCQIKPMDFAKIGLLLLTKGKLKDKVIIEEKYIEELIAPCKQNQGYGMLWWIDYEKTVSTIDDEIINELKQAGVSQSFIEKVIKVKGTYSSNDEYFAKIQDVFGQDPWRYISENLGSSLRIRKKKYSGNVSYRADGYLGNYLIVDPQNNIVAVRMISHQSFKNQNDGFADFGTLILNITK